MVLCQLQRSLDGSDPDTTPVDLEDAHVGRLGAIDTGLCAGQYAVGHRTVGPDKRRVLRRGRVHRLRDPDLLRLRAAAECDGTRYQENPFLHDASRCDDVRPRPAEHFVAI